MTNPRKLLGPLEQEVLAAIVRQYPNAYGVSIAEMISEQRGSDVSIGAIYTTLVRLEDKGYAKSRMGEPLPERGGKRRQHFTITGLGQAALERTFASTNALQRGLRPREAT